MKSIIDFITEKQNFLIKGHTKKQSVDYIDLGLPSGTLWATCNLGADKPEEPGLLFQWGRIDGYKCGDNNHKFLSEDDYVTTSGKQYTTGDILDPEDDAAYQITKGKAIIPTSDDFDELFENCNYKYGEINKVDGLFIISKKDDNKSLFLPITNIYGGGSKSYRTLTQKRVFLWTSNSNNNNAFHCVADDCGYNCIGYHKYNATPIRPIKKK